MMRCLLCTVGRGGGKKERDGTSQKRKYGSVEYHTDFETTGVPSST